MTERMTQRERQELGALIRKREKVLRVHAQERSALLLAEFDANLAKVYHYDNDPVWQALFKEAEENARLAAEGIAKRCEELGIPAEFAPGLQIYWHGRGQNAVKERQAELRRAAKSRIEAIERAALTKIERMSLEAQTQVLASGLESDAAKAFLDSMPAMDELMPRVEVIDIQKLVEVQHNERRRLN